MMQQTATAPAFGQLGLFEEQGVEVYLVRDSALQWSVRRVADGTEVYANEERNTAKREAEKRGYILR